MRTTTMMMTRIANQQDERNEVYYYSLVLLLVVTAHLAMEASATMRISRASVTEFLKCSKILWDILSFIFLTDSFYLELSVGA